MCISDKYWGSFPKVGIVVPNPIAWLIPEFSDMANNLQTALDLPVPGNGAPLGSRLAPTSDGFVIWLPSTGIYPNSSHLRRIPTVAWLAMEYYLVMMFCRMLPLAPCPNIPQPQAFYVVSQFQPRRLKGLLFLTGAYNLRCVAQFNLLPFQSLDFGMVSRFLRYTTLRH